MSAPVPICICAIYFDNGPQGGINPLNLQAQQSRGHSRTGQSAPAVTCTTNLWSSSGRLYLLLKLFPLPQPSSLPSYRGSCIRAVWEQLYRLSKHIRSASLAGLQASGHIFPTGCSGTADWRCLRS